MLGRFSLVILLLFSFSGCFDPTPAVGPLPSEEDVWELQSAECDAGIASPRTQGPALRLTIGNSSASARVSLATFPPVVCITEETLTYPTASSMRFVDGSISCNTSSSADHYPWGDGPDDVTFDFVKTGNYLILSKPAGDAGCNSSQTFNYVFELISG
ncbi:MAG: hypothetical protein A2X94_16225 [Bdellovibrionales bacterium GWB1_55_8]|nr:MAG: hypothetical protein A2X94_16225 [Bdellovibrionales bacterium GWB1_55_8]